jgi:hypothetical protein
VKDSEPGCAGYAKMNEKSKPSILLSLPPELWHQIMEVIRDTAADEPAYHTLPNAALAHRDLRPYAQEELLRNLFLRSEKQLISLVTALEGSSQLAEYAKRTELILIGEMEVAEEGMQRPLKVLFEMCCNAETLYVRESRLRLSSIGTPLASKFRMQSLT